MYRIIVINYGLLEELTLILKPKWVGKTIFPIFFWLHNDSHQLTFFEMSNYSLWISNYSLWTSKQCKRQRKKKWENLERWEPTTSIAWSFSSGRWSSSEWPSWSSLSSASLWLVSRTPSLCGFTFGPCSSSLL